MINKRGIQLYRDEDCSGNELILIFNGALLDDELIDSMVGDLQESLNSRDGSYIQHVDSKRLNSGLDIALDYIDKDDIVEICDKCNLPIYNTDIIADSQYMCAYCMNIIQIKGGTLYDK